MTFIQFIDIYMYKLPSQPKVLEGAQKAIVYTFT